jgi:site-specific recombinase XerD
MINRNNKKLLDEYLEFRARIDRLDSKSIRLERSLGMHYLNWCDETEFRRAPNLPSHFVEYIENLTSPQGEPFSPHYKRKLTGSAKHFFEWLSVHKKGYRAITPAWLSTFKYKMPPREFIDEATITEDEIAIIAKLPVESLVEKRVRAGVCFLYLSGMRISAFTTMPIKAVDLEELEVRQSPELGMRTKNKKSATTYILDIDHIIGIIREWDAYVRGMLPPNGFWFAPLSPNTREIDITADKVGLNRSCIFRNNLRDWLTKNQSLLHTPHHFRRGHANFLFDHAKDLSDLEAAKENLMHESLTTTEMYARKRRAQIKNRIHNMTHPKPNREIDIDLHNQFARLEGKLDQLLRSKNER